MDTNAEVVVQSSEEDVCEVVTDIEEAIEEIIPMVAEDYLATANTYNMHLDPVTQAFAIAINKLGEIGHNPIAILAIVTVFAMFLSFSLILALALL